MYQMFKPTWEKGSFTFTKDDAQAYLRLPTLPGERPINRNRVRYLHRKIEDGKWLKGLICTVSVNGTRYRLNGQHQSTMLLENPDLKELTVDRRHYRVFNMEEAAKLYTQFDDPTSTRSYAHIVNVHAANSSSFCNWPNRVVRLCIAAVSFNESGSNYKKAMARENRIELLTEHQHACGVLYDILTPTADSGHLQRDAVACAIFQTVLVNANDARAFWGTVRDGEMLTKDRPAKRLERYLASLVNTNYGRAIPEFENIYAKCITAWNAFRKNRRTALRVYREAALPEAV